MSVPVSPRRLDVPRYALYAIRYYLIRSFRDSEAETIFHDRPSRRFQAIETVARRKLYQLNQARGLRDLALPGNRLEALTRDRAGQHSIR